METIPSRWTTRLTRLSAILGPSVILGYDQGLDLKTCLACQYIVISANEYEMVENMWKE